MLYFLHIPKTAGTSITKFLDTKFSSQHVFPFQKWKDLISNPPYLDSSPSFIRGHFGYGLHFIFPNITYMTFLRNPFDHVVSWYEHLMRSVIKNKNERTSKIFSGQERLLDVLQHPIQKNLFNNPQIKHIALDVNIPAMLKLIHETKHKTIPFDLSSFPTQNISVDTLIPDLNISYKSLLDSLEPELILNDFVNFPSVEFLQPNVNEQLLLSVAKKRIENFSFFGLVEFMHESIDLLCKKYKWSTTTQIMHENIGWHKVDRKNIPSNTRELIKKSTHLDLELYKYAEKLFHTRYENFQK